MQVETLEVQWGGEERTITMDAPRLLTTSRLTAARELQNFIKSHPKDHGALAESGAVWFGKGIIFASLAENLLRIGFGESERSGASSIWLRLDDKSWLCADLFNRVAEREYHFRNESAVAAKMHADHDGDRRRLCVIAEDAEKPKIDGLAFDRYFEHDFTADEFARFEARPPTAELWRHAKIPTVPVMQIAAGAFATVLVASGGLWWMFGMQPYQPPALPPVAIVPDDLSRVDPTQPNLRPTGLRERPARLDRSSIRWDLHAFTLLATAEFIRPHEIDTLTWSRNDEARVTIYLDGDHPHLWEGLVAVWDGAAVIADLQNDPTRLQAPMEANLRLPTLASLVEAFQAETPSEPVAQPIPAQQGYTRRLVKMQEGAFDFRQPSGALTWRAFCESEGGVWQSGGDGSQSCSLDRLRAHAWQRQSALLARGHLRQAVCNYDDTSLQASACQMVWEPLRL